jgi:hypothetical protein
VGVPRSKTGVGHDVEQQHCKTLFSDPAQREKLMKMLRIAITKPLAAEDTAFFRQFNELRDLSGAFLKG